MKIIGIYAIRNTLDGTRYVGQAIDVHLRLRQHFGALRRGDHHCAHLQRAFRLHGAAAFTRDVLEVCDAAVLTEREQDWMDICRIGGLYNAAPAADSPRGIKRSLETKAKLRDAWTRRPNHSEATKQKMRDSQQARAEIAREKSRVQWDRPGARAAASAMYQGRVTSEATKEKLRAHGHRLWADQSYRDTVSKNHQQVMDSPSYRAALAVGKALGKADLSLLFNPLGDASFTPKEQSC